MGKEQADFEISFFERLVKKHPHFVDALIPLAEAYTRKGFHKKALQMDERLGKLRPRDPVVHYNLACSFALVGRKEEALVTLEHAISLGWDNFEHLKKDADLKGLHDDPRFQSLLALKSDKSRRSP